jgi:hypothetical protein
MELDMAMSWEQRMDARLEDMERRIAQIAADVDMAVRYLRIVATVQGALAQLEAVDRELTRGRPTVAPPPKEP